MPYDKHLEMLWIFIITLTSHNQGIFVVLCAAFDALKTLYFKSADDW